MPWREAEERVDHANDKGDEVIDKATARVEQAADKDQGCSGSDVGPPATARGPGFATIVLGPPPSVTKGAHPRRDRAYPQNPKASLRPAPTLRALIWAACRVVTHLDPHCHFEERDSAADVAYVGPMGWKSLRSEALTVVLMLGVFTLVPLLFGDPLPTWQTYVLLTLGLIAVRASVHLAPALWHRWRGPRTPGPELPTGRYGR